LLKLYKGSFEYFKMAKSKPITNTDVPKYEAPKPKYEEKQLSPEEIVKLEQQKQAELAKKAKEFLESIKNKSEKFKTEALKQFKKEIQGIVILPPKGENVPLDVLVLLSLEGDFEEKLKKKDEIEKKLKELCAKYLEKTNVSAVILDEIWDMCYKGKYEILGLLAMAIPIYDTGWVGALRVAEIHKSMVLKKFEKYVVSYVLAGSLVKGRATEESDIDTFVVIDDTDVTRMTVPELLARLRSMIWGMSEEAAMAAGVKNKLNVQVYILTEMWDSIRNANAVIFTFLRDGVPLYDRGMFQPWKLLLKKGKIVPTPEAVESYIKSGKQILDRTKFKLKEIASEDFFWSTLTPSQGILMMVGVPPPDPKETPEKLREMFVKTGYLEEKWPKILEELLQLRKDIEHGKIKDVTAKQIEEFFDKAEKYLERIEKLSKDLEIKQARKEANELYNKAIEDVLAALKAVGVSATAENAIKEFESNVVAKKLAPIKYLEVLKRIEELKKEGSADLREIATLTFDEDRLAKATFDIIRAEKGKKVEKFKISATYSNGKKRADIWLLSDVAYIIKDVADPKTPINKYKIEKDGSLKNEEPATLKEIDASLEKFVGAPTPISKRTIESLKKLLAEDMQIVIGA
jgi:predicted nucleotidyltransferase